MDIEGLQKLNVELQMLSARTLSEKLSQKERDDAQRKVVEVANKIASIAKQGDAPVWIVNLNRYRHFLTRSYCSYWIPGRKKDERFASTIIAPAVATLHSQAFTRATKPVRYYKPLEIAEDLCQEINGDLPFFQTVGPFSNLDNMGDQGARVKKTRGAFVSASSVPDAALLERETAKLTTYYMALADEARAIFGRTRDRKLLTTLHFEAGENLGIDDEEWCMNFSTQKQCQGCGKRVNSAAALCQHCGWILNEKAYEAQVKLKAKFAAE